MEGGDTMCKQKEKSLRFFTTWESYPYTFLTKEVKERHERLTATKRPAMVLTEMKQYLSHVYDVNQLDVSPRSKYVPEMLLEPCRRFEQGGKMGNFKWSALNAAISRVEGLVVLKHKVRPLDLKEVPFDGSKNSGLPYLAMKRDVYPQTLERAERCINGASPPPAVIFHRGKNTEVARPVFALPFEWHLIEGKYFYPLQRMLLAANTPYYVGKPSCAVAGKINEISYSPFVLEMDYSGFDGSLSGLLIGSSFRMLKKNLKLTQDEDELFERVASYFVTSPFLAPDQRVYTGRRHGVPSGSMFTQLIDTLCNMIIIEYISIRLGYEHDHYICVGDDSVTGFRTRPSVDDMVRVAREIGITVSKKDTKVHDTNKQFRIHFLGHYWEDGIPTRNIEETLQRMLAPERIRSEYFSKDREVRFNAYRERVRAYQEDDASIDTWLVLHSLEKEFVYPQLGSGERQMWPLHHTRFQNIPMERTGFDRWTGNRADAREEYGERPFVRVANLFV